MSVKYSCYVGILQSGNFIKYVTRINNANRAAFWEDGKEALKMGVHAAEDLVFGLVMNGHQAVVVKAPAYMELVNQ